MDIHRHSSSARLLFDSHVLPGMAKSTVETSPLDFFRPSDSAQRKSDVERDRAAQKAYNKRLVDREVARENLLKSYTAKALVKARKFAETTENSRQSRLIGLHIASTGELPQPVGSDGKPVSSEQIINQYLGLREALDYLSRPATDIDDVFYKARLLPVGEHSLSAHELADKLASARDAAELAEMLSDLKGLEQDKEKLFETLQHLRGNQKELIDYFSRALGLEQPGPKMFAGTVEELFESVIEAEAQQSSGGVGELLQRKYHLRGSRDELAAKAKQHRGSAQQMAAFVNRELRGEEYPQQARNALLDQVRDALGELESQWGGLFEANIEAEPFAARSSLPREFVKSYSDMLFEAPNFADAAMQMLDKFGLADLPSTVGLMSDALQGMKDRLALMKKEMGDEMRDANPDKTKLHATVTALSYMHMLSTLIETAETFVGSMTQAAAAAGIPARPLDATELLKGLIGIVSSSASWLQPHQFETMLKKMGVAENMDIRPLHKIIDMLRSLPDKAFVDNHARKTAIDGAQAAIDQAVKREDELADEQFDSISPAG
ncbi:MAG: TyeA family type III secretion system gatekeeper subunit [Janthinobacterium lividum]